MPRAKGQKVENKGGRPHTYEEFGQKIISKIREGFNFKQACQFVGSSYSSFNRWRKEVEGYEGAIRKAQDEYQQEVRGQLELSLYQRAMGFVQEEVKIEYGRDSQGNEVMVKKVVTKKTLPPDTASLIFVLSNIAPHVWQNKMRDELYTSDGKVANFNLNDVTDVDVEIIEDYAKDKDQQETDQLKR